MIEVAGLTFDYPGHRALEDVSFHLAPGTVTALVGPNGAGKTTLMRVLCGLERPVRGTVGVAGIDVIAEPRRSHRYIGYLPDFFGLYDELSVARCLRYAALANGVEEGLDEHVRRTAAATGLADLLDRTPSALSRGQRQRVAIGQAIIHEPRVLILDEPASGLDPEARFDLAQLVKALRDRGITLLVSSHILAELADYASAMLVLRGGRLIEHRNLAATEADERVPVEIRTAVAVPELGATLEPDPRVTELEIADTVARFQFAGGAAERAALLRALIEAGVPVCDFNAARPDLQRSYLASVRSR